MLEKIIHSLHSKIESHFDKLYDLVELIEIETDKVIPKHYIGNGQYKPIDLDNFAGTGYFRRNGEVSVNESSTDSRGCKQYYEVSYPLTLVGCIKKEVLGKDDPYSGESLCQLLFRDLTKTGLSVSLQARKVSVDVTSYTSEMKAITEKEFSGTRSARGIPFEYVLISMDIEVRVETTKECLEVLCESYCVY